MKIQNRVNANSQPTLTVSLTLLLPDDDNKSDHWWRRKTLLFLLFYSGLMRWCQNWGFRGQPHFETWNFSWDPRTCWICILWAQQESVAVQGVRIVKWLMNTESFAEHFLTPFSSREIIFFSFLNFLEWNLDTQVEESCSSFGLGSTPCYHWKARCLHGNW